MLHSGELTYVGNPSPKPFEPVPRSRSKRSGADDPELQRIHISHGNSTVERPAVHYTADAASTALDTRESTEAPLPTRVVDILGASI